MTGAVDKTQHPTVVEYGVHELFKGRSPKVAAKRTAQKLVGSENLFLGPGVVSIDESALEAALWDRMAEVVIAALPKVRPGKEDYALDGVLQQFRQKPAARDTLRGVVVSKLGHDPFEGHSPNAARWPAGLSRTQGELAHDAKRYQATVHHEDATSEFERDASYAPGDLARKFRGARPKAEPTTATESELLEKLVAPLELGFVSNAVLYAPPLRYMGAREQMALFSLLKGGAISLIRTHQPATYWLVRADRFAEPGHEPNATRRVFGGDFVPGSRLTPAEVRDLPVGTIVWPWVESEGRMDGSPLVVVADGVLAQQALLSERAGGEFPGGAPVDEWGREFVLIHAGSGKIPTYGTARRWADAWVRSHGMGRRGLQPNARRAPPPRARDFEFAGYEFSSGPGGTRIRRDVIDTSAPGDYGADVLGDGTFRMVPSGDIVDFEERNRRLRRNGHEPNASYYVWVMGAGDEPLDEGVAGPHDLGAAKTYARIAATRGVHDRAVSRGRDPTAKSFEVVRRYRAGTGERVV